MTDYVVSSGVTSTGITLHNSDLMTVLSGGTASGTTVNNGGQEVVSAGGAALGTTLNLGGQADVYGTALDTAVDGGIEEAERGGTTSGSIVLDGGEEVVSGTAIGAALSDDGEAEVYGTATGLMVSSGGKEFVEDGGSNTGSTVSNGGTEQVDGGGTDAGSIVLSGSEADVEVGGTAIDVALSGGAANVYGTVVSAMVSNGGTLAVCSGGAATGAIVSSGGQAMVLDRATASGTLVDNDGTETVDGGATASGTVVSGGEADVFGTTLDTTVSGGEQTVESGGTASGTIVLNGGTEVVGSSGRTTSTTVSSGGVQDVWSGGTAFGASLRNSEQHVYAGGTTSGTIVLNGGTEQVAGTAIATSVSGGGEELVFSGGTASGIVLDAGGKAELSDGAVAGGTIAFAGSGADLLIDGTTSAAMPAATISGFVRNTTIDLTGLLYEASGSATLVGDELKIVEGGTTLDLSVSDAAYTSATTFTLASDGGTGTDVTTDASCYRAGTLIRTERGEVPVEALRVGDRVVSALGGTAAVIWLGHRRLDCRRHPTPRDVWPVRVAAGAFGAEQPLRDLFLSPDHAVYVDGVLVPIRYLVNDATVVQEPVDQVAYWHVELPVHDVLFAEGMPAESYLDTGNRGAFANGGGATVLHPDFALSVWEAEACARLVVDGPELVAVRKALLARAAALGHVLTDDAGLHLRQNGRVILPESAGRVHRFRLKGEVGTVRLVSRGAIPAVVHADSEDHRRLGVAVSRIVLDGSVVPLADARLGAGWHAVEANGGWRWTDGDAGLDAAGAHVLEVEVAIAARYWRPLRNAA
jgi:autotransporter passenger strand-loop-strand repeat protein